MKRKRPWNLPGQIVSLVRDALKYYMIMRYGLLIIAKATPNIDW